MDMRYVKIKHKATQVLFPLDNEGCINMNMVRRFWPGVTNLTCNNSGQKTVTSCNDADHIQVQEGVQQYETYIPSTSQKKCSELEQLIFKYFEDQYSYKQICDLLSKQGYVLSLRSLERFLKACKLKRKNLKESPTSQVLAAIYIELQNSGCNLGYRSMWQRLRKEYSLTVTQKTVLRLLQIVDPEGIAQRKRSRLKRRAYKVPGPNHLWHVDGYDKIKRYGFPIHGCVDGFSKKIIWLEVASTNNKPEVMATYFINAVINLNCLPTVLRSDKGTENGVMASLQKCLRNSHQDTFAGENSYIGGKSTHNQRIESMWGQLRHRVTGFYINLFRRLLDQEYIDINRDDHIECLRFCFGSMIKEDLKRFVFEWNSHHIRRQKARNILGAKPNVLYNLPEKYGGVECKKEVNLNHAKLLRQNYCEEPTLCSVEWVEKFQAMVPNAPPPSTTEDALTQCIKILSEL